jgi:BMFP domain-containing protein YqiC
MPPYNEGCIMFNVTAIDELAKRLSDLVPAGARQAHDELLANFRDTLRAGLRKFDLVTRDEFDVQRCVLLRTREKVEALESRVAELETLVAGSKSAH